MIQITIDTLLLFSEKYAAAISKKVGTAEHIGSWQVVIGDQDQFGKSLTRPKIRTPFAQNHKVSRALTELHRLL